MPIPYSRQVDVRSCFDHYGSHEELHIIKSYSTILRFSSTSDDTLPAYISQSLRFPLVSMKKQQQVIVQLEARFYSVQLSQTTNFSHGLSHGKTHYFFLYVTNGSFKQRGHTCLGNVMIISLALEQTSRGIQLNRRANNYVLPISCSYPRENMYRLLYDNLFLHEDLLGPESLR